MGIEILDFKGKCVKEVTNHDRIRNDKTIIKDKKN
jgi:hypothetical protein